MTDNKNKYAPNPKDTDKNKRKESNKDTTKSTAKTGVKQHGAHTPRWAQLAVLIVILIATVVGLIFARKCARGENSEEDPRFCHAKSGGDTIDVAIEISPLTYSLATDTNSGLDYEMLRDMAKALKRPVRFHPFAPLDYAVKGLQKGVFDMVVSELHATAPLKEHLLLTDEVYRDRNVLVQRKDSPKLISEAHELGGDTVWIAKASPLITRIRNLSQEIGDTIYVRDDAAGTGKQLVEKVAEGKVPRAVVSEGLARAMAAKDSTLDISVPVSMTQMQTWAVADRDSDLQKSINNWLATYRASQRYKDLKARYMH